jgi:hypothetical protein
MSCADFRRTFVERVLQPTKRLGRLAFLFALWILVTFGSSPSLRTGGVMLSFICFMAILLTAASLIPGAMSLKLSPQGFTIRNWFKEETFRWTDVKEFRLITYRYLGFIPIRRQVGFKFSDTYKRNVLRRIAGALVSFDRILPDNFGMKAKQLAALLETARLQALADPANHYVLSSDTTNHYAISADPIVPE